MSKGKVCHQWPWMMKIWHGNSMNPAARRKARRARRTVEAIAGCKFTTTYHRYMQIESNRIRKEMKGIFEENRPYFGL